MKSPMADPVSPVPGAQEKKEMTHTPGPWTAVRSAHKTESWNVEADDAPTGYVGNLGVGFSEADARLIAAAPDLLAALKTCTGHDKARFMPGYQNALDAIRRAEGSPVS